MGPQAYDTFSKCLHWAMAAMIIGLLLAGVVMIDLPKGSLRSDVYGIHKQVGVAVLLLAVLRLGWRLRVGVPALPATMPPLEQRLAQLGHLGLYGLMLVMPLSGILMSQSGDHPVQLLGLTLPSLVGKDKELNDLFEGAHEVLAFAWAALLAAHVGAALRHHFVLKDGVLARMLPGRAAGS